MPTHIRDPAEAMRAHPPHRRPSLVRRLHIDLLRVVSCGCPGPAPTAPTACAERDPEDMTTTENRTTETAISGTRTTAPPSGAWPLRAELPSLVLLKGRAR